MQDHTQAAEMRDKDTQDRDSERQRERVRETDRKTEIVRDRVC